MSKNKGFARFVPATVLFALMFVSFPALSLSVTGEQSSGTPGAEIGPGVVVEKVFAHSEAEKAGLQEGDILLAWSRGDSNGEIRSPFDVADVEAEQEPLGAVKLEGLRGTEKQTWTLRQSNWGLRARPNFSGDPLAGYRDGERLANSGKPGDILEAYERWKKLAGQYSNSQVGWLPSWLVFRGAQSLRDAKHWREADDAYQSAIRYASGAGPVVEGQILQVWARAYEQRSDWTNAENYFQQSIAKFNSCGGPELTVAASLNALGRISVYRGDLAKADQYFGMALNIQEKLAPGSLDAAWSLNNLGNVANQRGDLAKAEQYHRRALDLREKLAPGSLDVATSLNNLGLLAYDQGDLAQAEQYLRRSLEIKEKLVPGSLDVALVFNNLGNVAEERGDLVQAERYHRQALEIQDKLAPQSLDMATILNNLGLVAYDRGDLVQAEQYHRQAFKMREKVAPGSLDVATSLTNLGLLRYEKSWHREAWLWPPASADSAM